MRFTGILVIALSALGCTSSPSGSASSSGSGSGSGSGSSGGGAPYTVAAFDHTVISSLSDEPNFQAASAPVDLGAGPFASAHLIVDLESPCFPFSKWQDDPPPQGENWPADCDAFDRNFEFAFDLPTTDGGAPGLELERAITPFGGPLHLDVDVTDIANGLPGAHLLSVRIPTWSDAAGQVSGSAGHWLVSAHFEVTPGAAPRKVLAVQSLFYGDMQSDQTALEAVAHVPAGTQEGELYYRVTGHGGASDPSCFGPAEEFCRRAHTLSVDGADFITLTPERTDCVDLCTLAHEGPDGGGFDYCAENPCGSVQSVRAPRANWCPGSETPPLTFEPGPLAAPGDHDVGWAVSAIAPGGSWRTSVTFVAYGS